MSRIPIGDLRWPVSLYTRGQVPDPDGSGTIDVDVLVASMHASIEPIRPGVYWGAVDEENDKPTHSLVIRGNYYLSNYHWFRRVRRYGDGITRSEHFRVVRVLEVDGRNRYIKAEVHMDRVTDLP